MTWLSSQHSTVVLLFKSNATVDLNKNYLCVNFKAHLLLSLFALSDGLTIIIIITIIIRKFIRRHNMSMKSLQGCCVAV